MMFGCSKTLRRIIYLKIRRDSCLFYRNLLIFFTATFLPVNKSIAAITVEETPLPIIFESSSYLPASIFGP